MDPENQNFLLESNQGKKKYETEYVSGVFLKKINFITEPLASKNKL